MQVPLFGIGQRSKSPMVSSQERINLYAEQPSDGERTNFVLYPTPGLIQRLDLGGAAIRGGYGLGDYLYLVHGSTVYRVDASWTATSLGSINTTAGRVSMKDNGAEIIILDGTNGYIVTISSGGIAEITDSEFPDAALTCTYSDGVFIVDAGPTSQRFYLSGDGVGTTWDSLDYDSADSNPDSLVRVVADHGELITLSQFSTEFWGYSGATDFPYSRLTSIEWGLAARWSLAPFKSSLIFLAQNKMGQVQPVLLNGYVPEPISTPELDAIINRYTTVSDATGYSYLHDGHPMYVLSFPAERKTWLFDGLTRLWSELKSGTGRHRSDLGFQWNGKSYVTDYNSGKVYELSGTTYTDNGARVTRQVVSRHILKDGEYFSVDELWVDMEPGVGLASGPGSDPQVMLQVSRDGGHSFGNELWRSIGKVGEYNARAIWRAPCGVCRDFVAKLTVTDPVQTVFLGGFMRIS